MKGFQLTLMWILCLTAVCPALGQDQYFQIKSIGRNKTATVKKGDFLQCIQVSADSMQVFSFGKVRHIDDHGVLLDQNPFLPGSGGFVSYGNMQNLEKISILKRSMLPALIGAYIAGQLIWIENLPKAIGPVAGVVAVFTLVRSIKHKRKSLFESTVNQKVFLITPAAHKNENSYFEY
jgi:hypothetical protein